MPNSSTYFSRTPISEWYVVKCDSKGKDTEKTLFKRDWTTFSKYVNHFKLISQHNWGWRGGSFKEHKILHSNIEQDFNINSKNYKEGSYALDSLELLIISY